MKVEIKLEIRDALGWIFPVVGYRLMHPKIRKRENRMRYKLERIWNRLT